MGSSIRTENWKFYVDKITYLNEKEKLQFKKKTSTFLTKVVFLFFPCANSRSGSLTRTTTLRGRWKEKKKTKKTTSFAHFATEDKEETLVDDIIKKKMENNKRRKQGKPAMNRAKNNDMLSATQRGMLK